MKNKSKTEIVKKFGKHVNSIAGSTVFKQNLINDVYTFMKWKKTRNYYSTDLHRYCAYLQKIGVSKHEISYKLESIQLLYKFLNISTKDTNLILDSFYKKEIVVNKNLMPKIKLVLIITFIIVFFISLIFVFK